MRRRLFWTAIALVLLFLLALMILQGSFSVPFGPADAHETILLSAVSALIFVLAVTLAFMLVRTGVKLFMERAQNREGSRIRSRLLLGALALTLAPTIFSAVFNYSVLSRTLERWFTQPAQDIRMNLQQLDDFYRQEAKDRVQAQANWVAALDQTQELASSGRRDSTDFFADLGRKAGIRQITFLPDTGEAAILYKAPGTAAAPVITGSAPVTVNAQRAGEIQVAAALAQDPSQNEQAIQRLIDQQAKLAGHKKFYRDTYFMLLCLLTLFVLFFATWSAQILARQISVPISALLSAAQKLRRGDLSHRVDVGAIDELATLVRAFNEMSTELDASARELQARRHFTEAILESIPTGVISVTIDGRIELVNRALYGIFSPEAVQSAVQLSDLFAPGEMDEIQYVLKRARRLRAAACQMELDRPTGVLHLAVTVASLEEQRGFVMVLEDTSDLLRAQKAAAWQEVARRIAHEIKNPLTPIALCAERISRQLRRVTVPAEQHLILDECAQTIQQEVQTVKTLVDEFSQFSRFPAAQLVPTNLNEVVYSAVSLFEGRLDGIAVRVNLDEDLPLISGDPEQLKRVIVNLVDNAAEAMSDSPSKHLRIETKRLSMVNVELSISDTGCGVSPADRERLFLPYFSTKGRGTGLGLAIASHIVAEHDAKIRLEDNRPSGTRFVLEFNALSLAEAFAAGNKTPAPTLKV